MCSGAATLFELQQYLNQDMGGIFAGLEQHLDAIDAVVPWHEKSYLMVKEFCQFSVAASKHWPSDMFCQDEHLGIVGIHAKVAAAFVSWLRIKSKPGAHPVVKRKVSTLEDLLGQTKAGLREKLSSTSDKPSWLFQGPRKELCLKRLFAQWDKEDYLDRPPRATLLEHHVQDFCCHCIWYSMQTSEVTQDVQLFLLHALILRFQSGAKFHKPHQPNQPHQSY